MAFGYYMKEQLTRLLFLGETPTYPLSGKTPYLGLVTGHYQGSVDVWYEPTAPEYARKEFIWVLDQNQPLGAVRLDEIDHQWTVTAVSGWGNIYGVVIFDELATGTGHTIFDSPWYSAHGGVKVPYYNFTTGCVCTLYNWDLNAALKGKPVGAAYSNENGAISKEFSIAMMNWLFAGTTIPYPRTYDIAIGKDAQYDPQEWGRFTGNWTECQGTGYNRIPVTASDWEAVNYYEYVQNKNEIVFTGAAPADWGTIMDVVLYAHGTDTPAFWARLPTYKTIYEGDGFTLEDGTLKIYWHGDSIF